MGSIKATYSAIENFSSKCGDDYASMVGIANEILSREEKMLSEVRQDYENISRQVVRLQMMQSEIESKVKVYEHQMQSASAEADGYSATISYLYANPMTVTSTDSEGNETTRTVVDYDGIRAAERGRDAAMQTYYLYSDKHSEAFAVYMETSSTLSRYETIKNAINAVSESIQSDIYEIKKYIRAIEDESEYNIRSLQGVINSLSTYLASKSIFMPIGAHYESFVS